VFTQILDPAGGTLPTTLLALLPVAFLLTLLAGFRLSAWLAVLLGSAFTLGLAVLVWRVPLDQAWTAYMLGSATGFWSVDWITLWGVVLFNTLVVTGRFERFRLWLVAHGTNDVRIQAMLFAWAFGALLEGLVGFGYPWAVVAPILVGFGIPELDALRVAAIANNAPVSYGALGAPIIALAAVTGLPLLDLSGSIGSLVAVLALLPPWVLIYLVSGRRGLRDGWPLAIVASVGYVAGQYPVARWFGPYLPDVTGSIVCFVALLVLLRFWRPREVLGYGGVVLPDLPAAAPAERVGLVEAWLPFMVLVAVVVLWTGPFPWAKDIGQVVREWSIAAHPEIGKDVKIAYQFKPGVAGSAILASWLIVTALLRPSGAQLRWVFAETFRQMWGAMLVGIFIFGLAQVFNFSGMAASMAAGFAEIGPVYLVVAPVLGWIGVALSGSNTSTNTMFGYFQVLVGQRLGFPPLLLPTLNSVGAEIGKPVAPQTASVGVSTSRYVRREGDIIRHNMGWTFVLLAYLIVLGVGFYTLAPGVMMPPER
jgi:lactate permease